MKKLNTKLEARNYCNSYFPLRLSGLVNWVTCFLLFIFHFSFSHGQDTIIETSGERIIGVVQEVGTNEIKYKKYATLQTSPVYNVAKYQVSMIKYADGTKDVFPVTPSAPAIPAQQQLVYPGYPTDYAVPTSISRAYINIGAMVSPLNLYNSSPVNSYWQGLYNYETSKGFIQISSGNTFLYSFFMGATLVFNKQNNWSYEFQFEMTPPNKTIHDSASYPDGTNGNLTMWFMLLNDAIQYMRGIDTSNNLQIGGEVSLDIGITFGGERESFYSTGNSSPDSTGYSEYDGVHVGCHIAAVGKYFVGKSGALGFELRLGYRFIGGYSPDIAFPSGLNSPVSFSGPFASIGILFRLRSAYSIDGSYYQY
jgi:hypothetical protein